jgi:hypothetical protein
MNQFVKFPRIQPSRLSIAEINRIFAEERAKVQADRARNDA